MNIALAWHDAGFSVVPIRTDGSKRPTREWATLQHMRLTRTEVEWVWHEGSLGVAVICGAVSKNAEMLELESDAVDSEAFAKIESAMDTAGMLDLWDALQGGYVEWTPSGGLHYIYRVSDGVVPGNTKIANRADKKTLAETRGEGGYVIVAPTSGACHPSGESWTALWGKTPADIMTLTMAQRDQLHAALRLALDETPPPTPAVDRRPARQGGRGNRPGDAFNERATWAEILEPHGWRVAESRGQETLWTRPGKEVRDGHSASTGYAQDADRMFVWSSSAGLPTETPMSKFYVYTQLNHGGDFAAATRELSRLGYGAPREVALPPAIDMGIGLTIETYEVESSQGKVPDKYSPKVTSIVAKTDIGNSRYLQEKLGDKYRYVAARDKWFRFDGTQWVMDPKGAQLEMDVINVVTDLIAQAVEEEWDEASVNHAIKAASQGKRNAAMAGLKGMLLAHPDDFDADPNLINMGNGILNLTTMELLPHNSSSMMTKKFGANYDPAATAPRWGQYLKEVVPDAGDREYLQRMAGYSLLGRPVERAMMVLHGPAGTGKSRFIETLTDLFGTYGETASEGTFRQKPMYASGPSNDLMNLRGARIASMSELDYGVKMDEALIKRMTGQDKITARFMYEENQTWLPQCVIWMATNHLFRIASDDGAIWERIRVVPFNQKIEGSARDPYLVDKLREEMDGILNWVLAGLFLYKESGLPIPANVNQAVEKYRTEQDAVGQFITDMVTDGSLIESSAVEIERNELYRMYQSWCEAEHEFARYSRQRFNARMEALGYVTFKRSRMMWRGLGKSASLQWVGGMRVVD